MQACLTLSKVCAMTKWRINGCHLKYSREQVMNYIKSAFGNGLNQNFRAIITWQFRITGLKIKMFSGLSKNSKEDFPLYNIAISNNMNAKHLPLDGARFWQESISILYSAIGFGIGHNFDILSDRLIFPFRIFHNNKYCNGVCRLLDGSLFAIGHYSYIFTDREDYLSILETIQTNPLTI